MNPNDRDTVMGLLNPKLFQYERGRTNPSEWEWTGFSDFPNQTQITLYGSPVTAGIMPLGVNVWIREGLDSVPVRMFIPLGAEGKKLLRQEIAKAGFLVKGNDLYLYPNAKPWR